MRLRVRYGRAITNVGTEFPRPLRFFGGCTLFLTMGGLPSQQCLPAARQHTTTPRQDYGLYLTTLTRHATASLGNNMCHVLVLDIKESPHRPSPTTITRHDARRTKLKILLCIYSNPTSTSTPNRTHHPPSCQVLAKVVDQCPPSNRSIQNYKPRLTHNIVGGEDAFLFRTPSGRVGKDTVQAMCAVVLGGQVVEGLHSLRGRLLRGCCEIKSLGQYEKE